MRESTRTRCAKHGCLFALLYCFGLLLPWSSACAEQGANQPAEKGSNVSAYDVVWNEPGSSAADSMPIGNGDIGLNVWTEKNGDVVFYIGKTDAWSENPIASNGLMKIGRVRISLTPTRELSSNSFRQSLNLQDASIDIREGDVTLRIWVDANRPVIHVQEQGSRPVAIKASFETWYGDGDHVSAMHFVSHTPSTIAWYHRNEAGSAEAVHNLTAGALMEGTGMNAVSDTELSSARALTQQTVTIHALTEKVDRPEEWLSSLEKLKEDDDTISIADAFRAHTQWWSSFWNRSWIFLKGSEEAESVTRGYILQRFVTAAAGRGVYPVKFNGSLFVVEHPNETDNPKTHTAHDVSANYRAWGGQYWFQNTRPMYWPRLAAGDFDEMLPLFRMYQGELERNAPLIEKYYGHQGSYLAETAAFYAPVQDLRLKPSGKHTDYYFTPILELSMMMLDYFEYTGDTEFAKKTLVPMASKGLLFFDKHFDRNSDGKMELTGDNSIETFWQVYDPAPDIAGLQVVVQRMIALPDGIVTPEQRAQWQELETALPALPTGQRDGRQVLLPYTGPQTAPRMNGENPELYAVYPFRLFGVGRPNLQIAKDSFEGRKIRSEGCWSQDPVEAAMVGDSEEARKNVSFDLQNTDSRMKFPGFWQRGHDYDPDEDNGGNGELGLQSMLVQNNGRQILLLPAWPKEWDAQFKLAAPFRTTVEGEVRHGKIVRLTVTPAARRKDVLVDGKPLK
jgi:alpha-L-fucosidase 2